MRGMKLRLGAMAVGVLAGLAMAGSATADMIDNFESYSGGQVIGSGASTAPWRRLGEATNDNVVATTQAAKVITGNVSATYGLTWPKPFGSARFANSQPANLSTVASFSVKMRSDKADTRSTVKLVITDGTTTYQSSAAQALTGDVQTFTFSIKPTDLVRTTGTGDLTGVLDSVSAVGFHFNSTGGTYTEAVIFDDFQTQPAQIPEPKSALLLGAGTAALGLRTRNP